MSFMQTLVGWFKTNRQQQTVFWIDPAHVDIPVDATAARAGAAYFQIMLVEMFLKKKVRFGQSWFPAAHSLVDCTFGSKRVEIPYVADTSKLFTQQQGTGDVVARNFSLSPRMPFNGGQVRLVAGLFAMQGQNYLNSVISMMSDFAGLLTVPQLSAALEVAQPLANGLQTLFGGNNGAMHLGYHDAFVGADEADAPDADGTSGTSSLLREGYIAVIRTPASGIQANRFFVKNSLLQHGDSLATCQPYQDADHMLLHIDLRPDRDDWDQLDAIQEPYRRALEALRDFEEEKAEAQIRAAIVAALQSPDLTRADRNRVVRLIKDDFKRAKEQMNVAGLVIDESYDLSKGIHQRAMTADRALEKGEPTYAELFSDL
jgi:hypothetical protein